MNEGFSVAGLLRPEAYPHPVTRLELRETHVSWVVLTGPFAYKIKKPVHFDFLDASTLARRAALCAEELRLNQRLAPQLYLDVVPVVREGGNLKVGGAGAPVEYALRMRQFDPACGLDQRLVHAAVTAEDMHQIAVLLAGMHRDAASQPPQDAFGRYAPLRLRVLGNIAELRALADDAQRPGLDRVAALADATLERLQGCITARRQAGHVRECHGDLHAANLVHWQQRWVAFDGLEFDAALRWTDTIADTAFLFMDLLAARRMDLAFEFLNRYAEESGDYAGLRLLPLHVADRALVRAKVALLRAAGCDPREADALRAAAGSRIELALRQLEGREPVMVLMHGLAASGKSSLAGQLVGALGAVRIRSDVERKRLTGTPLRAHRDLDVGVADYAPSQTARLYAHLLDCAQSALEAGSNVIVDASFLEAAQRTAFRELARRGRATLRIVSCQAGNAVLEARLRARRAEGNDPSEATLEVLAHQRRTQQPLSPQELLEAVVLDTGAMDPRSCVAAVRAAVAAAAAAR